MLIFLISCSPRLKAQENIISADTVIRKARETSLTAIKRLRSYKITAFSKSFFKTGKPGSKEYKMKGATLLLTEHYWKSPDKSKTIEIAERSVHGLLTDEYVPYRFDFIADFTSDHITMVNASVPGPLSEHAALFYEFSIENRTEFMNIPVYQVLVTPKSEHIPLFSGRLFIADSGFCLIGADMTFNKAVKIWPDPVSFRIRQTFSHHEQDTWLPDEFEYSYQLNIDFMGISYSGIWSTMTKVYSAEINPHIPPSVFSGPPLEKSKLAAYKDSSFWELHQILPLSEREKAGLQFLLNLPKNKKIAHPDPFEWDEVIHEKDTRFGFSPMPDPRFNRVEGAFLGGIAEFRDLALGPYLRTLTLKGEYGYGFRDKRHKWLAGADKSFFGKRLAAGGRYYDHIQHKENLFTSSLLMNSLTALGYRYDNYNYFYTRGYELFLKVKPVYAVELEAVYTRRDDRSARQNSKFGIVRFLYEYKPVYPVNEGRLSQLSVKGNFRIGNGKGIASREPYYLFRGSVDYSSPGRLHSDFHFSKYYGSLRYHIPTTRRGSLDGCLYLGYATKSVPRQYVFDLYGGSLPYMLKTAALGELEGNYMAAMTIEHNFGGAWMERTGLPVLKEGYIDMIPNVSVGYVRTSARTSRFVSYPVRDTKKPLIELGLGFGDIYRIARVDIACRVNQFKATESFWILTASAFLFNE